MSAGSASPRESSITWLDEAPASVSEATRKALAPFDVRWCGHAPHDDGTPWCQHGYAGVLVGPGDWFQALKALKAAGLGFLRDHTAVDYPERSPRFTVVASLVNLDTQEELLVKTRVADGQPLASLVPLWRSADWAERETFDMFGIAFSGHPDLTRIYMPQDYDGWPMRRDFPLQGHLRFQD